MYSIELGEETRGRAVAIFDALSHPVRLRIVEILSRGERTVGEMAVELAISQPNASQHLATLTRAGLLVAEPRKNLRYYRIRGPRIARILELVDEFCQVHKLYRVDLAEDA